MQYHDPPLGQFCLSDDLIYIVLNLIGQVGVVHHQPLYENLIVRLIALQNILFTAIVAAEEWFYRGAEVGDALELVVYASAIWARILFLETAAHVPQLSTVVRTLAIVAFLLILIFTTK